MVYTKIFQRCIKGLTKTRWGCCMCGACCLHLPERCHWHLVTTRLMHCQPPWRRCQRSSTPAGDLPQPAGDQRQKPAMLQGRDKLQYLLPWKINRYCCLSLYFKVKQQYLLTWYESRYCCLTSQGSNQQRQQTAVTAYFLNCKRQTAVTAYLYEEVVTAVCSQSVKMQNLIGILFVE